MVQVEHEQIRVDEDDVKVQPDAENMPFEEFLQRYEGIRAEWENGKVFVYMTNNTQHQDILLFLSTLLNIFLGTKAVGRLLLAGIAMRIPNEDYAPEPDLLIVLTPNLSRIQPTYLDGVADIVVEIVSPESSGRDRGRKFDRYEAAGVPEYWLFDPLREEASVYALRELNGEQRYGRVPPDAQGRIVSPLLPGFVLDPALMWAEQLPNGQQIIAMVQEMVDEGIN
jgi:Uma2 family endonuclease